MAFIASDDEGLEILKSFGVNTNDLRKAIIVFEVGEVVIVECEYLANIDGDKVFTKKYRLESIDA